MNMDKYQLEAAQTIDENVCCIACAGSGKTTVLVERANNVVARGNAPESILCLSFSKSAVENMKERLGKKNKILNRCECRTFHSLAGEIAKRAANYECIYAPYDFKTHRGYLDILNNIMLKYAAEILDNTPCITEIVYEYIKSRIMEIKIDEDELMKHCPLYVYDKSYKEYMAYLKEHKILTYDTVISEATDVLNNNPQILSYYRNKFKFIQADEYQDTSPDKHRFLRLLTGNNNLFVVGDAMQAIFGFAGGNSRLLANLHREMPIKVINLPINYRCSGAVVEVANAIADTSEDSDDPFYKPMIANNPYGEKPLYYSTETKGQVFDLIRELKGETILLSRTRKTVMEDQSKLFKNGIPYCNLTAQNNDYGIEFDLVMAYLDLMFGEKNNKSLELAIRYPAHYITKNEMARLKTAAKSGKMFDHLEKVFYTKSYKDSGIRNWKKEINNLATKKFFNAKQGMEYVFHFIDTDEFIEEYLKNMPPTSDKYEVKKQEMIESFDFILQETEGYKKLSDFYDHFKSLLNYSANTDNSVKLSTIHKSKGLQYDNVVITHFDEDILPHKRSTDWEEEIKLLYVAATRAKNQLVIVPEYKESHFGESLKKYCEVVK